MKKEQGSYAGQGEGFLASQMRLIVGVNVFMLLLSIGLHWPYQSERYFFNLTHPMTTTIALSFVLMAGFLAPIWLAQLCLWLVARQRDYITYFVTLETAKQINPKKFVPFVLRIRFNTNSIISALYLPQAVDAPQHMPSLTVVYFVYLLVMMSFIMFTSLQTGWDEVVYFFVRSGAVAAFMGAWAHYRQSRSL